MEVFRSNLQFLGALPKTEAVTTVKFFFWEVATCSSCMLDKVSHFKCNFICTRT